MHQIGIISDSHGSTPTDIYDKLNGVECILHAGDLGSPDVLLDLEVIAPVHAVCGNIDFFSLSNKLPRKKVVQIGGIKFGITHGDQFKRFRIEDDLVHFFRPDKPDIIVFGHTHQYFLKKRDNLWLVNPGSANCNYSPTGVLLSFVNKNDLNFQLINFCQSELDNTAALDDNFD